MFETAGNVIERKKTREELIKEAGITVYKNLITGSEFPGVPSLAEKIVTRSTHAHKPFDKGFYNSIEFTFDIGINDSDGFVLVMPRLDPDMEAWEKTIKPDAIADEKTKYRSGQSVTLKLENIFDKESEMKEATRKIWEGVTDEQKIALADKAVEVLIRKFQDIVGGEEIMRSHEMSEESIREELDNANKRLVVLRKIKESLNKKKFKEKFIHQYAWLGVGAKSWF